MEETRARCGACGRAYGAREWRALASVCVLTDTEVASHVVGWPSSRRVEVRACTCGRAMARTLKE
jgi:hypothetical protein